MNTSYLTTDEYKRAPTAMDTSNLDFYTGTSNADAQTAELANVIARASAWVDNICEMPSGLAASVENETFPEHITRDGYLRIFPKNVPIIQLQSLQWRVYPTSSWTNVDVTNVQVYPRWFELMMWFPFYNGPSLSVGGSYAFPVSMPYTPYVSPTQAADIEDLQLIVQYSYVNGFPNTTLSAQAAQGAQSITVDDATGVIQGTVLTIYDGANTEKITVTTPPVGNTLTLAKPLIFTHNTGVAVSAIPADVKQATILLVNYLLKERGVNSVTIQGAQNPLMQKYDDVRDVEIATKMLQRYRRAV